MQIPKPLKNKVRLLLNSSRLRLVRTFLSYDRIALIAALRRIGIQPGDLIIAHCSFEPWHGFNGCLDEFVAALIAAVGDQGTLAMVSMPYSSSTREYLNKNPVFNVRRTPSAMGLVSEHFRRRHGVCRSLSPTHPVLACGRLARQMTDGHENCVYPCGPGSPFEYLAHNNGKVLFVNATLLTMTFFHYLEHLVWPSAGIALYEPEPRLAALVDWHDVRREVPVYAYAIDIIQRRRSDIFWKWLLDRQMIHRTRIGATHLTCVDLNDAVTVVQERSRQRQFFYNSLTAA